MWPTQPFTQPQTSNQNAFADNSFRMKTLLLTKAFAEQIDSRTQFAERSLTSIVCRKIYTELKWPTKTFAETSLPPRRQLCE
jgi:hypothetical protein